MKRVLQIVAVSGLFVCTIQADITCLKKISVTARKKDPKADTKRITVKITSDKGPISSLSFTKNTTGPRRTQKLYFCFEQSQSNDIQVFEGEKYLFNADKPVGEQEGRYGAALVIDTINQKVVINYNKPKTIKATLVLPKDSGSWLVVSGDKNYTAEAASSTVPNQAGILEKKTFQAATNQKNSIEIYKNRDIQIFARKGTSGGVGTEIDQASVKKAGSKPVIVIDPTTSVAKILSSSAYAKLPAARAASSSVVTTGASSPAGAAALAQSQVQPRANKVTPPTLSEHIALKHLLLNKGGKLPWKQFYTQNQDGYKFNEVAAKALMDQELNKTLVETPYVAQKLSNVMLATPTFYDAKKQAIRKLQGEYDAVYAVLLDSKETIGDKETKQIKALRTAIINALK